MQRVRRVQGTQPSKKGYHLDTLLGCHTMVNGSLSPVTHVSTRRNNHKYDNGLYVPPTTSAVWSSVLNKSIKSTRRKHAFEAAGFRVKVIRCGDTCTVEDNCAILADRQPVDVAVKAKSVCVDLRETWCNHYAHRQRFAVVLQFAGEHIVCTESCTVQFVLPLLSITIRSVPQRCVYCISGNVSTLQRVIRAQNMCSMSQMWGMKINTVVLAVTIFRPSTGWHCLVCGRTFDTLSAVQDHMHLPGPFVAMSASGSFLPEVTPQRAFAQSLKQYSAPVNASHLRGRLARVKAQMGQLSSRRR